MGQPVAREGDEVNTGHGCDATTKIAEVSASRRVVICGKDVAVKGDPMDFHTITNPAPPPAPPCIPHTGAVINEGSAKVLVGGKPIARVGDSADLGTINSCCSTVLAG